MEHSAQGLARDRRALNNARAVHAGQASTLAPAAGQSWLPGPAKSRTPTRASSIRGQPSLRARLTLGVAASLLSAPVLGPRGC